MADNEKLREATRNVFNQQLLAVLATHEQGQPHTSLVGFVASEDLSMLFFATERSTRKFTNLQADPRVSLLIDTRTHTATDFSTATAITVYGQASEVQGSLKQRYVDHYLQRLPQLRDFVLSPTCALVMVKVDKYSIVTRFKQVQTFVPVE